jgi:hypothetical protein
MVILCKFSQQDTPFVSIVQTSNHRYQWKCLPINEDEQVSYYLEHEAQTFVDATWENVS